MRAWLGEPAAPVVAGADRLYPLLCCCARAGPGGNRTATAKDMRVSPTAVTYAKALRRGRVQVYPTKAECCIPNLGAFAKGCSAA